MKKYRIALYIFLVLWLFGLLVFYLHHSNFAVLNPKGLVAARERQLMIITVLLGLLVIVPVYIMTFFIAWRYREGNSKAKYSPELTGSKLAETVWWGIPTAIILALSIITWQTSHSLDPSKALAVSAKPLTIQVVALNWKWLFIYPEQNVASVNFVQLPVNTPVTFDITADAPMNSFWIPQLGGQIYAMPGMSTQLHLIASKAGDYTGTSANVSGEGFADMKFTTRAGSKTDFDAWVTTAKQSPEALSPDVYQQLVKPTSKYPVTLYASAAPNLYDTVINKYMAPGGQH